jgi:hypothetical protein
MLAVDFNLKLVASCTIYCQLTLIASVSVVLLNSDNIRSVNLVPLVQIRNLDWTEPSVVILINRLNFNFICVISIDKQVVIDVNKLDLEEEGCACNEISNVNGSNTGIRVN